MNNPTRFLMLVAVITIGCMASVVTASAQPNLNACARQMCTQMRSCSTYVPQPSPQYDKTDKPTDTHTNLVQKQKGGNDAQGISGTCRFIALMHYNYCSGEQEGLVEPNNTSTGNTVKPVAVTPKK